MDENPKQSEQFLKLLMLNDRRIYAYILTIVPNSNDADDIMQEVSSVMWRKFDDFKPGMDFAAWGMTIARYQILSYFKKRKGDKLHFDDDLIDSIGRKTIEALPEMEDRLRALKKCVKKLEDTDRDILQMRYEKNFTLQNIGAHLSKSTRAAYYALVRIHRNLMHCIRMTMAEEN